MPPMLAFVLLGRTRAVDKSLREGARHGKTGEVLVISELMFDCAELVKTLEDNTRTPDMNKKAKSRIASTYLVSFRLVLTVLLLL